MFVRASLVFFGDRDDSPESRHHRDYLDNRANALTSRRFGWAGPPYSSPAAVRQRRWFRGSTPRNHRFVFAIPGPSPGTA